jgi:hypothetical protein
MKIADKITVKLQPATIAAHKSINEGTASARAVELRLSHSEPLLVLLDGLLSYANSHEANYGTKLKEDYFLGPEWLTAATSVRALLNGNGGVANWLGKTTDSKDNGALETIFWEAMAQAGFSEDDM